MIIGNGTTGYPNHTNYINFNKIEKEGIVSSIWQFPFEVTRTTDIRNQQSFSVLGNRKILGITSVTQVLSGSLRRSARLVLNDEMTAAIDSNWTHMTNYNSFTYNILQHSDKILSGLVIQDPNNLSDIKFRFTATDSTGILLWQNDYICPDDCWTYHPQHIIPTQDGGYLLTAEEQRSPPPLGIPTDHEVSTLIKTDSLGTFDWRIYPGGVGMPYSSADIVATPTDDGNILCAWTDRKKLRDIDMSYQINEDRTIWFAKIDLEGNKLWEKNITEELEAWNPYEYFQEIYQMIPLSDGNIAISTSRMLLKVTQDAELIWARDITPPLFNPPNTSEFSWITLLGLIETSDGGFLCTGEAHLLPGDAFPEFVQTGFVIKVDEHGCLEEGCQLVDVEEVVEKENNALSIYPNPTNQNITIKYQLPHAPHQLSLTIYNITGKSVHTQPLPTHQGSVNIELDKSLPVGTYFCHLTADGQVADVERFVLIRN